jgi:hypothetical protein
LDLLWVHLLPPQPLQVRQLLAQPQPLAVLATQSLQVKTLRRNRHKRCLSKNQRKHKQSKPLKGNANEAKW